MHRLSSKSVLRKFKIASLLMVLSVLCLAVAIVFLIYGIVTKEVEWIFLSGWCLFGTLLLKVFVSLIAVYLRCPLCMVSPLQNRGCSKHKTAAKLLWSYRLKIAQSILLQNKFRCQYCGEETVMEVRMRSRR